MRRLGIEKASKDEEMRRLGFGRSGDEEIGYPPWGGPS